jgi:hypothetical protein
MKDTTTASDAYRLLFEWGEARAKSSRARNETEQRAANEGVRKTFDALAAAADGLWAEWIAEQSR